MHLLRKLLGALIDSGANGTIAGKDCSWWDPNKAPFRYIDLTGIDDHIVEKLKIIHACCVATSDRGKVILHLPESAGMGTGQTIFSVPQMESGGCTVVTRGYRFPLCTREGLAYLTIRPVLDSEWNTLPHTYLTHDTPWKPSVLDHDIPSDWATTLPKETDWFTDQPFDAYGNVKAAEESTESPVFDDENEDGEVPPREVLHGETHPVGSTSDSKCLPVNRRIIKAHLSKLVDTDHPDSASETTETASLTDSDGEYGEFHFDSGDEPRDPFEPIPCEVHDRWFGYDVLGRPRRKAASRPVDYNPGRRRARSALPSGEQASSQSSAMPRAPLPVPGTAPVHHSALPSDDDDHCSLDDDGNVVPITSYNNPAKSTDQETPEQRSLRVKPYRLYPSKENYAQLAQYFGGATLPVLKKTFENTTQLGRLGAIKGMQLYHRRKAPNPALNIPRRNEPVATDTVFSGGTPAVDNGSECAQLFVGRISGFCSARGLGPTSKKFARVLMDEIRQYGAMDQLVSDSAKVEISNRVKEILGIFGIKDFQSEPYNKNQNFAERVWQQVQQMANRILNMNDCPHDLWLLALEYACFIMNHTAFERLNWRTPTEWLLGYTPDITVLLQFRFYEPVYN